MSDAALLGEAITTAVDLARAYAAVVFAFFAVCTFAALLLGAAVGWLLRAAWRGVSATLRASQGCRARFPDHTHHKPHSARTGAPRYEEAA